MSRWRVLALILRDRDLRRVEAGITAFAVSEFGTWLAITVYAYREGGVRTAGIVSFIQLIPAAVLAPIAAFGADRFHRGRVLAAGFLVQAVAFGATAAAMIGGLPPIIVYAAAVAASVSMTLTRPAAAAVLPSLARTPALLTAANVVASLAEQAGAFAGPAAAGLLLALFGPGSVFLAAAILMAVVASLTIGLQISDDPDADEFDEQPITASWTELSAGARLLRSDPRVGVLVGLMTLVAVLDGAVDVALVVVAVEFLGRSDAAAGGLATVAGLGGAIGASASIGMVGLRRLTLPLAIGLCCSGAAIAAIAGRPGLPLLLLLLAANGFGSALVLVAGRTMLQGLSTNDVLARVFGIHESMSLAGLAVGSLLFALVGDGVGAEVALLLFGSLLPVGLLLALRRLMAIDASRPPVDEQLLRFVRDVSIFSPLPPYAVEQLLGNFEPRWLPAGETIIRQGDDGDQFHLITGGSLEITISGEPGRTRYPGEFVGEIALLRNIPRTATVTAGPNGATVMSLERSVFLQAISAHPRSLGRVTSIAEQRSPREPPTS